MRRLLPVVLSLLLLSAGCVTDTGTPAGTDDGTPVGTEAPDRGTATEPPTATRTLVDPDNPYGKRTLTVAVENRANGSRSFLPQVREALAYWEDNSRQYAGYPVAYDLRPNATDPDVLVRFVDRIEDCGDEGHAVGCAPRVDSRAGLDRPVTVRVEGGYADGSTLAVLKHELGHTLGLAHGEEPAAVMAEYSQLRTLPRPNATERALPWNHSTLSVHVVWGPTPDGERDDRRDQIDHALDYYAAGAAGTVPDNVSFRYVGERADADVVVRFSDTLPCGDGAGSCGAVRGSDPDGDGALETYTRLNVTLSGLDTDATGWHVGYWLGYGFGFEASSEYPPPFRDASAADRRSDWWN